MEPSGALNLLVIDRDTLERGIVARLGVRSGFTATRASCEEAIMAVSGHAYAVIVIDLAPEGFSCPNFGPIAVEIGPDIPVVVLSHSSEMVLAGTQESSRITGLNVVSVLSKPISLPDLEQTLTEIRLRLGVGLPVRSVPALIRSFSVEGRAVRKEASCPHFR